MQHATWENLLLSRNLNLNEKEGELVSCWSLVVSNLVPGVRVVRTDEYLALERQGCSITDPFVIDIVRLCRCAIVSEHPNKID
jgi:hypothetical protein